MTHETMNIQMWFAFLEIPFLLGAVIMAFLTARSLQGGVFGRGMSLIAWGLLVMAIGHLHMQIEHLLSYSLFQHLFGAVGGTIAWFVALMVTWLLTGLGFFNLYKASHAG